jgi:lysophospholipase L1-like esterase
VINQGLNDRSETSPSIRGIRPGNSPAAFVDNMTYVIDRVRGAWVSQGWSLDQLHVLVCVAHPVSTPQSLELQAYLDAMRALARTDIAVTSLAEYHTEATYVARGWYATTTDRTHLSTAGYDATSMTLLQSVLATACDADFNGDGGVDGTDVFAFFEAWQQGDAAADVSEDGGVDGTDVEAFFVRWEAGC